MSFSFGSRMTIELLFGLSLLLGFLQPFSVGARHAVVPSTVPREHFATAIALDSAFFQTSRFIGPAIAGILIPTVGVGGTFAAGRTPAEMEKLVLAADWDEIFRDKPPRKEIALRRKYDDYKTLFAPEFGLKDGSLALPKGLKRALVASSARPPVIAGVP